MYIDNTSGRFFFVQSDAAIVRLAPRAVSLVKRKDEPAVNAALQGAFEPHVEAGVLTVVTAPKEAETFPGDLELDGPDDWAVLHWP